MHLSCEVVKDYTSKVTCVQGLTSRTVGGGESCYTFLAMPAGCMLSACVVSERVAIECESVSRVLFLAGLTGKNI